MTCARRPAGARNPAPSTSAGSRRLDARTGRARRLTLLLPALALLLGALSPFAAAPAAAQNATLVSNLDQTRDSTPGVSTGPFVVAQAFTTGSAAILSSIDVVARTSATAAQRNTVRAELWSRWPGGAPNAKLADLTVPASLPQDSVIVQIFNPGKSYERRQTLTRSVADHGAYVSFAAPANTRLEANTTYFLVVYTVGGFHWFTDTTSSSSEDKHASQGGWSIADAFLAKQTDLPGSAGTWTAGNASLQIGVKGRQVATPATVSLSASPAQAWEGASLPIRVVATLSRAQPFDVDIPVQASPCPEDSWCNSLDSSKNSTILIRAGSTTGFLNVKAPRDADAQHEEATVSLKSSLPDGLSPGSKTSQKIRVLDPDGFAMTLTADKQPAEGGGVVKVTVDLGQPAPDGFFAKINSSASTAKFGHSHMLDGGYRADWTMDGKVQVEEPYVAAGPVLPRSTSSTRGPCVDYGHQSCNRYISAADWNNRDWQRMHYLKDWNGASKKTLTIRIADDPFVDPGETIVLQGIGYIYATGIDHGGSTGFPKGQVQSNELRLTIKDNDGGAAADDLIVMGALPTIARESGTGADSTARMQVWLSRPAEQKVTVVYSTVSVFATSPADFTSISATTLTFEPGETRKEIEITIKDDTVEDSGEYFFVSFNAPKPASVVRLAGQQPGEGGSVSVTIINDEADLEGLKLWGAPGAGGPYARLDLGAFDGAVSDYAVTVPHGTTHAKLAGIAPQNEPLTLKAGRAGSTLTAVRSNVAGPAVPLAVGDTVLVVQSTASTGERKTYRVTVTREAQAAVAVSLSATPNPVAEGSPVTVRATLATALSEAVTIPLTVTRGTSEDGDHGSLASIEIPAGGTSATGTVSTVEDDDGDDETFTVALGSLPSGLAAGSASSVEVTITDSGLQQRTAPLTAAFENVPSEHDGTAFTFDLTLSEMPGAGNLPVAASFKVAPGKASVSGSGTRYTVTVTPKPANAWKDVTVTLLQPADCAVAGAICTADGRALSNSASATVGGPVRIRIEGARAKEGKDESLDFAVTLNRAAAHVVSVDYATEDGTAAAGADYTATSGTLTFAAGETAKTVSVPVLDDAIDEGKEVMRLKLSNPRGAFLRGVHTQAKGVIRNADPLPKAYLGHFGRRVASDAIAVVTGRFETPRDAGSHLTFAGQRLSGDGAALADAVAGLARAFGAEEAAPGDDPLARHGLADPWNDPASAPGRAMTGRELLTGTSFRAVLDQGTGAQLTSWGQGASVSHFSGAAPGLSLSGEAATGALGMDYERGRLLAGFALTHSLGAGTAHGAGETYALGSSVTTVLPYARFALTERVSAWTLAGTGSGGLTLDIDDDDAGQRHRTDLSMTLAAAGMRGDLVPPTEADGLALAVKADAFWVRTESNAVRTQGAGSLAAARADATRLRAVLDGKRTFALTGDRTLAPSLELGLRHDGGDAGTGTGMELGAGVGFTDPSRGLDMALRVYGLAAHAEDSRREWGVSGSLKLVPGGSGRGLSMSLTPSYGVDRGDAQRLWTMPDAHALATNDDEAANPSSRLDTELGYGLSVFGGGFTGTPNVGFGLSETARDWRLGWRLTPAASGDTGFEVSLDATRREAANDDAEHGVMVRGAMRW